jgi:DNA-binding protein HU-beta
MNKTEFISAVATKASLSKADARKGVDACIQTIEETIKQGDKIVLLGFGTFDVYERAARKGINPKTKESIDIPARKVVRFKPGAALSDGIKQ